ncbi:MAG: ubiquinone/menaquinone biosynthesis methyltransferase [Dehalococcoidia bacterium]
MDMSGESPSREQALTVRAMFDGIAPRYDLMNRVMSAGQDGRWRRIAARSIAPLPPGPLLDIGAGTGDLALALRARFPGRAIVGADLSREMMQFAVVKGHGQLALAQADVLHLPFPDATFAGAATAFTLRNVAGLESGLVEIERVLLPGGRFACLEITRPRAGAMAGLFNRYFHTLVPRIGGLLARSPGAYRYLPASVDRFVSGEQLALALRRAGFADVRMRRFWPGAVTLHVGRRRDTSVVRG